MKTLAPFLARVCPGSPSLIRMSFLFCPPMAPQTPRAPGPPCTTCRISLHSHLSREPTWRPRLSLRGYRNP